MKEINIGAKSRVENNNSGICFCSGGFADSEQVAERTQSCIAQISLQGNNC